VLVGPVVPTLDREMFPSDVLRRELSAPGSMLGIMRSAQDAVDSALPYRCRYRAQAPGVELVTQSDGKREILFAANVSREEARFGLEGLDGARLAVLWGGDKGAAEDSGEVRMPGYSVFAWEVVKP